MDHLTKKSLRPSESTSDKLPFFLNKSGSPKPWFQLLETKYDFNNLSSPNKFYQTISCLPETVLKLLSDDLVEASLSCNPYNSLKDLLIEHYRAKPLDIIRTYFIANPSLNDEKPSEYLSKSVRELESLHPGITAAADTEHTLRSFFVSALPSDVQKIVNGVTNIDLRMLAEFADKMSIKPIDNRSNGLSIAAPNKSPDQSSPPPPPPPPSSSSSSSTITALTQEIFAMKSEIKTLKTKIDKLEERIDRKNQSESIPNSSKSMIPTNVIETNPPTPTGTGTGGNGDKGKKKTNFCFYHLKYGSGAQKCQLGCLYQPKPMDLKVSSICIHHARFGADSSQCLAGCSHYSHFTGHSLR